MSSDELKENIIKEINKLPEESLQEVNDFVEFILSKSFSSQQKSNGEEEDQKMLDPSKDPILKMIGIFDEEPFADKIDDLLYGKIE